MTTSGYMPDVKVEIAFDSGFTTPAGSRTWTDVSAYVELKERIDIGFGRADELSTADANTLKVVLDNSDGRFTPDKTGGAYYPNVKIGRPIRVTATRVGGSASVRFLGFIDAWNLSPAGGANPTVTVTATSQLARLGLLSQFYGSLESSWASLTSLYKLSEAALPALDSAGTLPPLDTGSPTWRSGVGPAGAGTAIRIGSSSILSSAVSPAVKYAISPTLVFEFFVAVSLSSAIGDTTQIQVDHDTTTGDNSVVFVSVQAGSVLRFVAAVNIGGAGPSVLYDTALDDALHHLAMVNDGANLTLYVDGTAVGSTACAVTSSTAEDVFISGPASGTADLSYVGVSSDVAGISERALAGLTQTGTGDTASERLTQYAAYAGVQSTDIDTTTETLSAYPLYDKTMLEAMRAAELSDGGVLYDAADGTLTYNDRESRYSATSAFTLAASSQQVEASLTPRMDRSGQVNEATVTITGSDTYGRASDQTSIDAYGNARSSWEIQGTQDMAYQAAAWAVSLHAEPSTRIPNLEVDLLPFSGATQDSILAATIGTRFGVTGLPADLPASSLEFFVEGYTESIGRESYTLSFNVSPRDSAKWDVWTIEDATYGAYDSNPLAW